MTYRELNELFCRQWADEKGIIRGKPVMLIYRINQAAGKAGMDANVDKALLRSELQERGLSIEGL